MDNVSTIYKPWYNRPPTDFDVGQARSAIKAHEAGNFQVSGLLADAIMRDDRIKAVTQTRANGLLGLPYDFELETGDARRRKVVLATAKGLLPVLANKKTLRRLLRYRWFMGWAMCEVIWDTVSVTGQWVPTLKVWHPTHFRYDVARNTWVVNTQTGPLDITPGQGKWVLFSGEDEQPWLDGLVRALAIPWLIRQFAYRDWARYSEVHGLPIRKAQVPAEASDEDRARFFNSVAALGSESTVELPELVNGQGKFDLTLLEAAAKSHEGFRDLLTKCETSMAITMLGQNLTTEGGGPTGSRALGQVQDQVRQDYKEADAEDLADGFTQVMRPWALFNYGAEDLAPWLKVNTDPPADLKTDADTMNVLSNAVATLEGAGFEVDEKELSEKYGFTVKRAPKPEPVANPAGPGAPVEQQPGAQDGQQGPGQEGAAVKASRTPEDPATVTLASGAAMPQGSGFVQGQLYTDGVTDSATQAGAASLVPDLAAIVGVIEAAEDYDGMRAGLKALYPTLKPAAFAKVMEKAIILSGMGGRLAVAQDL